MKKTWIDYLRVLSVIAVITIHSTAGTYNDFGQIEPSKWWIANILNSFARFSVPMFVMMSGCLLLGRNVGLKEFFIKRGRRLIPAFLFWSLFYILFDYLVLHRELTDLMEKVKTGLLASGSTHFHLWYLAMFICLMLFVPFINNYVIGRKPVFEDFVYLFSIFALLYSLNQISTIGRDVFDTEISWFKLFPWFIGYFVLGYFMDAHYQDIPIGNRTSIIILCSLLCLSPILNFFSSSTLKIIKEYFILNSTGILNFILTMSIFHIFSRNREKFRENYWISKTASLSFGIYLIHPAFIPILRGYFPPLFTQSIIGLPLLIITTFLLSFTAIALLSRIKWFKLLI